MGGNLWGGRTLGKVRVKTWSSEVAAPGLQYMEEEKAKGGDSSFSYQSFEAFSREKEASWDSMEIF